MAPEILGFLGAGLVAGILMAVLSIRFQRGPRDGPRADAFSDKPLGTDVINMSSVRVAGVGGLGLDPLEAIAFEPQRIGRQDLECGLFGVSGATLTGAGDGERAGVEPAGLGRIRKNRIANERHAAGHSGHDPFANRRDGIDLPAAEHVLH
jgi:hypothetical protein